MLAYIALLRAVNVGGTGKLAMTDLKRLCEQAGFGNVTTYIASGNVVFTAPGSAAKVKEKLEAGLASFCGKPVGVFIRTQAEMAAVLALNPFHKLAGNRTVAIFLDAAPPSNVEAGATGRKDELIAPGHRELYVFYGEGMGTSKLKVPCAKNGTARNMNTVAKLVEMAAALPCIST